MSPAMVVLNYIYYALLYVNLALGLFSLIFYILGSLRAVEPWKGLKQAFAINMGIGVLIYLFILTGQQIEPSIGRFANTLLLICLAVSSYIGVARHDAV